MSQLAVAVGEVQRFVAGTRDKTAEQVQRLANAPRSWPTTEWTSRTSCTSPPRHSPMRTTFSTRTCPAPWAPSSSTTSPTRSAFICAARSAASPTSPRPRPDKLCAQYLGPAMRLLNFNLLPSPPLNPYLGPVVAPDNLRYADPALAPGGAGGAPVPPEQPPAVSAYTGSGDVPPPPGFPPAAAPAEPPPPASLPDVLLPAEAGPPAAQPPAPQQSEGAPAS